MQSMLSTPDRTAALRDITDQIHSAIAGKRPLHIRGGGSKDFYGMARQGAVLDTSGLNGILSYEPSELVVTVAAGTPLHELESVLHEQGQCLAFEPPHFAWSGAAKATVGGMVASGLAGPARASVGGVRDYVLGLQLINGKGEHLTFGGQVMKNVAGYDVSRLMVGAMGTLGLITEVSLKVLPIAPAEATLAFELNQLAALEQLHRWGGQPLPLNASCWVHDASDPAAPARDLLFVRLRGAVAAVYAAQRAMLADAAGQVIDQTQAHRDWNLCRDQRLPFFSQAPTGHVLWRLSVPQTAPALELPWPQLVEWHGGLRWLWAPMDAAEQLQSAARASGGNAMVFVAAGAGSAGPKPQLNARSPAEQQIAARVKQSFDPSGIFNPDPRHADYARS
jgi:glycolate oxidase FAD binding subunit